MNEETQVQGPTIKRYARFNPQGQITSILTMPEDMDHPFDDLLEIDEKVGAQTHYVDVVAQEVRAFTPDEQARYANYPTFPAAWDGGNKCWIDLRSLEELKAAKWGQIKQSRNAAEFSVFEALGHTFDCDPTSTSRLMGALQMATLAMGQGQAFEMEWTLADNSAVQLTGADLIQVGQALALHVQAQHAKARGLRERITQAISLAELDEITWV